MKTDKRVKAQFLQLRSKQISDGKRREKHDMKKYCIEKALTYSHISIKIREYIRLVRNGCVIFVVKPI